MTRHPIYFGISDEPPSFVLDVALVRRPILNVVSGAVLFVEGFKFFHHT